MNETLEFLEFSIPCKDVGKSLAWYQELGFTELQTSDVRAHHYAVVTDGDFCIGLHGNNHAAAGLSFVRRNLAHHVRRETLAGAQFESTRLGEDEFNEAVQSDPDGTLMIMLEARTFSPGITNAGCAPVIGRLDHIVLPCMRLDATLEFWQEYGFISVESGTEATAELHFPGVAIQLREGTRYAELQFCPTRFNSIMHAVARTSIAARPTTNGFYLTAPEGTRLVIENAEGDAEQTL